MGYCPASLICARAATQSRNYFNKKKQAKKSINSLWLALGLKKRII
jgi:hypothetical protein